MRCVHVFSRNVSHARPDRKDEGRGSPRFPGQRDALIAILLEGISDMPGCLGYVVARDPGDPDGIWITEVRDSETSHKASLSLPQVKDAIAKARPIIAGFESHIVTEPVGGQGMERA